MTGIKAGATFMGVLFAVPDMGPKRDSKTLGVAFDGGEPVGGGLEPPPGTAWREAGVVGTEFDSI